MSTPEKGQLWTTTDRFTKASRFFRVSEVDDGAVSGYSWWDYAPEGKPARIALEVFRTPRYGWTLAEEDGGDAT